jgi:hypothetical protein
MQYLWLTCDAPPIFLEGFKCEFESENNGRKKEFGLCSLTCSTSRVRGARWSFKMETRMSDKQVNYSHKLAQTKQQVG